MSEIVIAVQKWLDAIDDDEMHHLGEYFTHATKKKYNKQNATATIAFRRWLILYYHHGRLAALDLSRFNVYNDWCGEGFLFRRKRQ